MAVLRVKRCQGETLAFDRKTRRAHVFRKRIFGDHTITSQYSVLIRQ